MRRQGLILPLAVAAAALALRLLHLAFFAGGTPFFDPAPWNTPLNPMDPGEYDRWARQILGGDWLWTDHGQGVYFQSPVYPYFVALVYLVLGGRSLVGVAVAQAILGAATCGLAAWTARRLVSPAAGWIAGILTALYGPAIFYGALLLKETLAAFLLTLAVTLSLALSAPAGLSGRTRPRHLLVIGAAWGAAVAAWPLLAPIAAVVMAWTLWKASRPDPGRPSSGTDGLTPAIAALLLAVGLSLAIAPVTLRNLAGEGRFVLISDAGPRNWEIGNAANSTGTYIDFPEQPMAPASAPLRPAFWRLFATKLALFAGAREIPQVTDYDLLRPVSPLMRLPLPGFGLLLPLALAGMVAYWRRARDWLPLYAVALLYPILVAVFFVVGRFRLPAVPILAMFAAAAVVSVRQAWPHRRALVTAAVALVAAVAVNWPRPLPQGAYPFHHSWGRYWIDSGDAAARAGRPDQAVADWQRARQVPLPVYQRQADERLAGVKGAN